MVSDFPIGPVRASSTSLRDGFATLDRPDRQRSIAEYEEAVAMPRGDRANAAVRLAVGSPVRTQSAAVSPTPFDSRHYSAVYSVMSVRITIA